MGGREPQPRLDICLERAEGAFRLVEKRVKIAFARLEERIADFRFFGSHSQGKQILTVEGVGEEEKEAFVFAFGAVGAVQCGFCIPGMVMSAKSTAR